jgi:hypothetical protein
MAVAVTNEDDGATSALTMIAHVAAKSVPFGFEEQMHSLLVPAGVQDPRSGDRGSRVDPGDRVDALPVARGGHAGLRRSGILGHEWEDVSAELSATGPSETIDSDSQARATRPTCKPRPPSSEKSHKWSKLASPSRKVPEPLQETGVEQRGIEHPPPYARSVVNGRPNDADQATRDDQRRREVSASGEPVDVALAAAIEGAAAAGRWDLVIQLARELEARRLARVANVVPLTKAHR